MPLISANTLFHFTPTLEILASILRNDFYPRYCIEDWNAICQDSSIIPREIALPMTCFCDIPLSSVREHSEQYGKYAIGMSKEWGTRSGLAPVLYVHAAADSSDLMFRIRKSLNDYTGQDDGVDDIFYDVVDLLKYTKAYRGRLRRREGCQEDVLFYNECEWRYSPATKIRNHKRNGHEEFRVSLYAEEFADNELVQQHNERIQLFRLPFTIEDIKYIIIESESERLEAVDMIQEIKGQKFTYDQVRCATSKILSMEQVFDDF